MKIVFVIPCYNEELVLPETAKRFQVKVKKLIERGLCSSDSHVLFIDDGSNDNTWKIVHSLHYKDSLFQGLRLSRNYGHQNALFAGMMAVRNSCDACISMDADLQDDMEAIDQLILEFLKGCDVVYGVKNKHNPDGYFKQKTASFYYRLLKRLGVDIICNHADFRLMSARALNSLSHYREVNLFLRGLIPLIGLRKGYVYYDINKRFAGESKYSFGKMLSLAVDGITSFSVKPLRMITVVGIIILITSSGMFLYTLITWLSRKEVAGWMIVQASYWMLGGIQLFGLGIIGAYIGKILSETKGRPRFIVEQYLCDDDLDLIQDENEHSQ
jgi:glycosyltransferase involved in cell wall biosynthesis